MNITQLQEMFYAPELPTTSLQCSFHYTLGNRSRDPYSAIVV